MTLSNNFNIHSTEWRELKRHLLEKKAGLVNQLISANDDEIRGRIKQIDEILSLDKGDEAEEPAPVKY